MPSWPSFTSYFRFSAQLFYHPVYSISPAEDCGFCMFAHALVLNLSVRKRCGISTAAKLQIIILPLCIIFSNVRSYSFLWHASAETILIQIYKRVKLHDAASWKYGSLSRALPNQNIKILILRSPSDTDEGKDISFRCQACGDKRHTADAHTQ
jgi:hypothetical protein